ncbi:ParB N-terminal domain-containing protein [Amycolatopsis sp. NPDC021455]|uniref:ParB/RepB/Spo0J family partition protein n=1 Tax=Amycolatopsis sp. NPDC021455 TaxID=3154901 RepID=UPI0033E3515B
MTALAWRPDVAKVHPAAELFPLMSEEDFAELVEDIRTNGLLETIMLTPSGEILDGRHRLMACRDAGVEPRFATHNGDPWVYVISLNLHRRHLTDVQRAVIAGKIAIRAPGERERDSNASAEAFEHPPPSQKEAADLLKVSRTAVQRARSVLQRGTPEVAALVEEGKVPLATADRVVRLPPEEQEEFVRKVASGMRPRGAAPREKDGAPGARRDRIHASRNDSGVISRDALQAIATDMNGIDLALKTITSADPDLSEEDRKNFDRALTKGIHALSKIRRYLRITQEGDTQP